MAASESALDGSPPSATMPQASSPFLERLRRPGVIVGDGAMGTMLYSKGVPAN
jgi:hypothetical protein